MKVTSKDLVVFELMPVVRSEQAAECVNAVLQAKYGIKWRVKALIVKYLDKLLGD